jgi:dephospho-CoA kinase
VLSTICTIEIQRTRALARNKMDSKTIDKIIADQVSNEYRQQHADILIYTDLTHEDTVQQVEGLLDIT